MPPEGKSISTTGGFMFKIFKKSICFYLSVSAIILGLFSIQPINAEARIIKKAGNIEQASFKEVPHYQKLSEKELEKMSGGELSENEKCIFGGLGMVALAALIAVMVAASGGS
jgi:hypothetical protein